MFDKNNDGVISQDELAYLLGGLGEDVTDDVVTELMNLADTDGDGMVNIDEFCAVAAKQGDPTSALEGFKFNTWAKIVDAISLPMAPKRLVPGEFSGNLVWPEGAGTLGIDENPVLMQEGLQTTFTGVSYAGQEPRMVFDRRTGAFANVNMHLFPT